MMLQFVQQGEGETIPTHADGVIQHNRITVDVCNLVSGHELLYRRNTIGGKRHVGFMNDGLPSLS